MKTFDEAVTAELSRVSHIEYDSHEICKHFAGKLRERLAPAIDSHDELLEALEWAVETLGETMLEDHEGVKLRLARAAIAKARGE